ncbi:alpha/beta hydrolase [Micromonospora sonneratiae]|uniref:Alpha/beta fold hydrolase n=1 Tax=Micromonospora sonneratiae TaxID=1184706 RepID=A0ABW3YFQ1_9ACTN
MPDLLIDSTTVPIAARDLGGDGAPMLLIHGAGANLESMQVLAEALRPAHRVVTVDLRGHGRSGDGPWNWDDVLGDLDAVADGLGLGTPAVVGVSLGGMIAAQWAQRHPEGPGAVSLDGNPPPSRPEQLAGMDHERAVAELDRLHTLFAMMAGAMAEPLSTEQLTAARSGQRMMAERYGGPSGQAWVATFERNLHVRDDGTLLRPRPETTEQLRVAMAALDLIPDYRATRCPLLLVLATENLPEQQPFHELYEAYRRGLFARINEVRAENPHLRVVELAGASHAMVAERPEQLAELVTGFFATPLTADR